MGTNPHASGDTHYIRFSSGGWKFLQTFTTYSWRGAIYIRCDSSKNVHVTTNSYVHKPTSNPKTLDADTILKSEAIPLSFFSSDQYSLYTQYRHTRTYSSGNIFYASENDVITNMHVVIANDLKATHRVKKWTVGGTQLTTRETNPRITITTGGNVSVELEQYKFRTTVKAGVGGAVVDGFVSQLKELGSKIRTRAYTDDSVNYVFGGWFYGVGNNLDDVACTTWFSDNTEIEFVTPDAIGGEITLIAKFIPKKTRMIVEQNVTGTAVKKNKVSVYVNSELVADKVDSYTNGNLNADNVYSVVALPDIRHFFKSWLYPSSATGTSTSYSKQLDFILQLKPENKLIATFNEKVKFVFNGHIENSGKVTYSGVVGLTEGSHYTGNISIADLYIETDYTFTAEETNRLWAFSKWQYMIGENKFDLSESLSWVKSMDGKNVHINIPDGHSGEVTLIAVFAKKDTFAIETPSIEGDHPLNATLASANGSGCSYSTNFDAPDEVVDGVNRWIGGTDIEILATPGTKWVNENIKVSHGDTVIESDTGKVSLTLTADVSLIQVIFQPRKYRIEVSTHESSQVVGGVKLTYHPISNQDTVTTIHPVDVWVDDSVIIEAFVRNGYTDNSDVDFGGWYNASDLTDAITTLTQTHTIVASGTYSFVAKFKALIVFSMIGAFVENNVTHPLGNVLVTLTEHGATAEKIVTLSTPLRAFITCGDTFNLRKTCTEGTSEAGTAYTSVFDGWGEYNVASSGFLPIQGWGEEVDHVIVSTPRKIQGGFSQSARWPILILRNPEGQNFSSFVVGGVKVERSQEVDGETVTLVDPNHFFCDRFSIVQVRLIQFDSSSKFLYWKEEGANAEVHSESRDISVFMTGNLTLLPYFFTGQPISVYVELCSGNTPDQGRVSIEGDYISYVDESGKADFVQGGTATLVAMPNNGYKFVSWHNRQDGMDDAIGTTSRLSVNVDSVQSFYAKFEEDRNAIYRFAKGDASKTITWRSRTIVFAQPTRMSCMKVDAEGYDNVSMAFLSASSPDVPTKGRVYRIANSNSRKCAFDEPKLKMLQIEIQSTTPINSMLCSSGVGGLLNGEG